MIFDVVYIFKENYEKKLSTGYVFFRKSLNLQRYIMEIAQKSLFQDIIWYERRIHTFAV